MIVIENHKIVDSWYRASPNTSGPFAAPPTLIVMHYTAGGDGKSSAAWLCKPEAGASAHIVVDRDGALYQIVPFNVRAWHAGESTWKGRAGCNAYSVGIEIANWGWAVGANFQASRLMHAAHKHGGPVRGWETYDAAQLDAVEALTRALIEKYPSLVDIAGHDDIAPSRKQDPGPAFPMDRYTALLGAVAGGTAAAKPRVMTEAEQKAVDRALRASVTIIDEGHLVPRTLRAGDTGDDVRALQRALNAQQADMLEDDGVFDATVVLAVRRFQEGRGLAVDGVAGRATLSALGLWPS